MSRVTGSYTCGTRREYRDFVRAYTGEVVNVIEVNDWGEVVTATLDEWGNRDFLDVRTYEDCLVDFVCRWDDPKIFVGANI